MWQTNVPDGVRNSDWNLYQFTNSCQEYIQTHCYQADVSHQAYALLRFGPLFSCLVTTIRGRSWNVCWPIWWVSRTQSWSIINLAEYRSSVFWDLYRCGKGATMRATHCILMGPEWFWNILYEFPAIMTGCPAEALVDLYNGKMIQMVDFILLKCPPSSGTANTSWFSEEFRGWSDGDDV